MNTSSNQFGLMVAYLLPGFIGLAAIAPFAPIVAAWLQPLNQAGASLGAPVYAVLAATTIGLIVSCFRWLLIDHVHRWTGIIPPVWDDSRLEDRLAAFDYLVESHYRYYQFVSNTLVVLTAAYALNRWMGTSPLLGIGTDIGVLILAATLFIASRDALSKYYTRTGRLLGRAREKGSNGHAMYNGNDHQIEAAGPTTPPSESKPDRKPTPPPKPVQGNAKPTEPAK
jgi:hypothetical protein